MSGRARVSHSAGRSRVGPVEPGGKRVGKGSMGSVRACPRCRVGKVELRKRTPTLKTGDCDKCGRTWAVRS